MLTNVNSTLIFHHTWESQPSLAWSNVSMSSLLKPTLADTATAEAQLFTKVGLDPNSTKLCRESLN